MASIAGMEVEDLSDGVHGSQRRGCVCAHAAEAHGSRLTYFELVLPLPKGYSHQQIEAVFTSGSVANKVRLDISSSAHISSKFSLVAVALSVGSPDKTFQGRRERFCADASEDSVVRAAVTTSTSKPPTSTTSSEALPGAMVRVEVAGLRWDAQGQEKHYSLARIFLEDVAHAMSVAREDVRGLLGLPGCVSVGRSHSGDVELVACVPLRDPAISVHTVSALFNSTSIEDKLTRDLRAVVRNVTAVRSTVQTAAVCSNGLCRSLDTARMWRLAVEDGRTVARNAAAMRSSVEAAAVCSSSQHVHSEVAPSHRSFCAVSAE